jgi:hypothetical protein
VAAFGKDGLDGIPLVFIRFLLPLILPVLTELFNYILTYSTFPLVWKISSVVPISKKFILLQRNLTIALFLFYLSLQSLLKMLCTS